MTAPRTLQALALDKIVPKFLGKNFGKKREPLIALFLTAVIGLTGILVGQLNAIANLLTMFFLITYGMLNFVVVIEHFVENPSFRPRFKFHWGISLLGGLGSFSVMFLIDYKATFIALAIVAFLFIFFLKKEGDNSWDNIGSGFLTHLLRKIMHSLSKKRKTQEGKNWRPFILGFSSNLNSQDELINMSINLGNKKGVSTLFYLIEEDFSKLPDYFETYKNQIKKIQDIYDNELFIESCVVKDAMEGELTICQVPGFGDLKYNTVLMGWVRDKSKREKYSNIIRNLNYLKKNLIILRSNPPKTFSKRIDIWWGGMENDGKLMILFAHLLKLNDYWDTFPIVLKSIASNEKEYEDRKKLLNDLKKLLRIDFQIEIYIKKESEKINDIITESSKDSRLVFIGLGTPEKGKEKAFISHISDFLEGLPTTLLVKCGINIKWEEM